MEFATNSSATATRYLKEFDLVKLRSLLIQSSRPFSSCSSHQLATESESLVEGINWRGSLQRRINKSITASLLQSTPAILFPPRLCNFSKSCPHSYSYVFSMGKGNRDHLCRPIGGGCINRGSRYDTDTDTDSGSLFVKTNKCGDSTEALCLRAMYDTKSINSCSLCSTKWSGSFIIMESIEFGGFRAYRSALGRKLAEMHKTAKSDKEFEFGSDVNNSIGHHTLIHGCLIGSNSMGSIDWAIN
ncbi:protein-ribulosamine 3-kinase [Carex littledalei]|uniref:Protein-ribulosamine 3-kinase n=1 Tax=Carex littledalei TaxID=544730 RepID=A0A833VH69_9POAL|nr:protein-ribulosamine 3-kinase [Carex littledalei]